MFPERRSFDVVVLGGGPAAIMGAMTAADCGASVAVVDSHAELGGAGVNTGAVPGKTPRNRHAVNISLRREAAAADFLRYEQNVKSGLNTILAGRLESSDISVFRGFGSFADANTIRVRALHSAEEVCLDARHVLIATGSSPVRPAIFPFGHPGIYDSDCILDLPRLPQRLAVIGGGVIGSEYACTFAALGAKVHLIDRRDALPTLDGEVSVALAWSMAREGVEFHWNERLESCRVDQHGEIFLRLKSGARLACDAVLVATARRSNMLRLRLAAAGLSDEHGLIHVDEYYRTDVHHIYAAGDAVGFPALPSTSMQQARTAMLHAFRRKASHASRLLPSGVHTIPEVGTIGETEDSLRKKSVEYVVGRSEYRDNARRPIVGDAGGFIKLLFQCDNMKLVGVHLMGEHAAELVHVGMMAMVGGATAEKLAGLCFNLPTLGELYKRAALDAIRGACEMRGAVA